ncbi:MAG TPA: hypothetical protein VIT87_08520 [Gemmatimonadales bacterium]
MTQRSAAATKVAKLLWSRAASDDTDSAEEVAAVTERTCLQLRAGLGRWIGAMGYRALLDRALILARAEHPALVGLSCHGGDEEMIATAVRTHGAAEVAAGMVALVAGLVDLLGRIIGEEIAVRLVEETGVQTTKQSKKDRPSPRGVVSITSRSDRDVDAS